MKDRYYVLFLCTGNSARSLMGEALVNAMAGERLRAFSAGSHPTGQVHPMTVHVLESAGLPTTNLRSKSWEEFAHSNARKMDLIITVCDQAAGEACPTWPGHPVRVHWSIPDPARVDGTPEQIQEAFTATLKMLQQRISQLLALPLETLDSVAAKSCIEQLGQKPEPSTNPLPCP